MMLVRIVKLRTTTNITNSINYTMSKTIENTEKLIKFVQSQFFMIAGSDICGIEYEIMIVTIL